MWDQEIILSSNLEYYVVNCTNEQAVLSLDPFRDQISSFLGCITREQLNDGIYMPGAKIRFYSTEGTIKDNIVLDEDGFYLDQNNLEVTENVISLPDAINIVNADYGRQQISWRINDLKTGVAITNWNEVNLHDDYPIIYPETELKLIAEWDYGGATFNVIYVANGTTWKTETFTYSEEWVNLTQNTPSRDKYTFTGWRTDEEKEFSAIQNNDTADMPYYNEGSLINCKRTSDLRLYALWKKNSLYSITIKSNGGRYGQGSWSTAKLSFEFPPSDAVSNSDTYFDTITGMPKKHGYTFKGWRASLSDRTCYAGDNVSVTSDEFKYEWIAQWKETVINLTKSIIVTSRLDFTGQVLVYKIIPDRNMTCRIDCTIDTDQGTNQHQKIRILDSIGQLVPFLNGKYYLYDSAAFISLKKGKPYYLEIKANKINNDYYAEYRIDSISDNDGQISADPTGGSYYIDDYNSSSESFTVAIGANKNLAGISSTTLQNRDLSDVSIDIKSQNYYGKPYKSGYQFKEWLSESCPPENNREFLSIRPWQSSYNIYVTNYLPTYDFNVKATWELNTCYINYDGNNPTEGHMTYGECKRTIPESLFQNNYKRSTIVTYNTRGGFYEDTEWETSTQGNMIIVDKSNSETRSSKLYHNFAGWYDSDDGTGTQYNDTITIDDTSYGYVKTIYAKWQFNKPTILPTATRPGFIFMGWFTEDGIQVTNETELIDHEITLYAHWDPIGLVMINTPEGWKKAVPYIYTEGTWKRALTNIYTNSNWQLGTNLGQNATDEQLEFL